MGYDSCSESCINASVLGIGVQFVVFRSFGARVVGIVQGHVFAVPKRTLTCRTKERERES